MRQLRDRGVSLIFSLIFSIRFIRLAIGSPSYVTQFCGLSGNARATADRTGKNVLGRELDTHALQRAGRTLLSTNLLPRSKITAKKERSHRLIRSAPRRDRRSGRLAGIRADKTAEVIFGIKPADSGTALIKANHKRHARHIRLRYWASASAGRQENRWHHRRRLGAGKYHFALQAQRGWLRPISRKEQQELPNALSASLAFAHLPPNNRLISLRRQSAKSVAFTLATDPTQFLILDEPTRGIDVGAHAESSG